MTTTPSKKAVAPKKKAAAKKKTVTKLATPKVSKEIASVGSPNGGEG